MLGYFRQRAVYVSGVDQRYLSLVLLALFVHHGEYALRAGQGHYYGVELLGNLIHRHIEALGKLEEGGYAAQSHASHAADGHHSAHDRQ